MQMCLACNDKPAASQNGTVPLCTDCGRAATDHRGVQRKRPQDAVKELTEEAEKLGMY